MSSAHALLTLWLIHLGVAMSPGVNFALIGRTAARYSRREALLVVAGVVSAALVWVTLAIFGMAVLMERTGSFFTVVRLGAAAYLIVLGVQKLLSREGDALAEVDPKGRGARPAWHYISGVLTNLGNPKAILFFSSLFATAFPADTPLGVRLLGGVIVLVNSATVHGGLALIVSNPVLRRGYLRWSKTLDRVFGAAFIFFGIRIAVESA